MTSGLLIKDINNHLPVFVIYDWQQNKRIEEKIGIYICESKN